MFNLVRRTTEYKQQQLVCCKPCKGRGRMDTSLISVRQEVEVGVDNADISSTANTHTKTKMLFNTRKHWESRRNLQDFFVFSLYFNSILIC